MGIDRVGKGGAPPPTPETSGAGGAEKKGAVERPFQVERPTAARQAEGAAGVDAAQASTPLARLRAGEIDVERYLDLRVDEATSGIEGLSAGQVDEIKRVLRDQLASDPGLTDLVRMATGQAPKPPED